VWVGGYHDGPSTETATVRFYRSYTPTKLCLIVNGANREAVVAEAAWSPPPPPPLPPPAPVEPTPLWLTTSANSRQRLRAPRPGDRYNNLVTRLRCSRRCTAHLRARPYYRPAGYRRLVPGSRFTDTFRLPARETQEFGFWFPRDERKRFARVIDRYGPILWKFRYRAESASGETDYATVYIRMVRPPAPRPPSSPAPVDCQGYSPCIPPGPDVDCAGGSGNGPRYVGLVHVYGSDPYGLDSDGDGLGCE